MSKFFPFVVLFAVLIFSSSAGATPRFQYGTALTYPVSLEDGQGLPVSVSHEGIALFPLTSRWALPLAVGFSTGMNAFRPAPHVQAGVASPISERAFLGATVVYRYSPHWAGSPGDAHIVGVSAAPGFLIAEGVVLVLPIGVAHNLTVETWSGAFTSKIAFSLP